MKRSRNSRLATAILCLLSALLLAWPTDKMTSNVSLSLFRSDHREASERHLYNRPSSEEAKTGKEGEMYYYDGKKFSYALGSPCSPEDQSCLDAKVATRGKKNVIAVILLIILAVLCVVTVPCCLIGCITSCRNNRG